MARNVLAVAILFGLASCQSTPVVTDPPKPPDVTQCLLGPTQNVSAPPMFAWELPAYLVHVLGILTEERTLRQGERDCITQMRDEGVVR